MDQLLSKEAIRSCMCVLELNTNVTDEQVESMFITREMSYVWARINHLYAGTLAMRRYESLPDLLFHGMNYVMTGGKISG